MSATAADVPPELYEIIFDRLTNVERHAEDDEDHFWHRNYAHVDKRDIAACALVCRHWARMFQPRIFFLVVLRSGRDVEELITLLRIPSSQISDYIEWLVLVVDNESPPWVHHVALDLVPELPHLTEMKITISRNKSPTRAPKNSTVRSIHQSLPRSPPIYSVKITSLEISRVHFHRFEDLVLLAGELPDLETIRCSNVTWSNQSEEPPTPSRRVARCRWDIIAYFSGCTNNWSAIRLVTGMRRRADLNILGTEVILIGKLVKSIDSSIDYTRRPHVQVNVQLLSFGDEDDLRCKVFMISFRDVADIGKKEPVAILPDLFLVVRSAPATRVDAPLAVIDSISVDFSENDLDFKTALGCDWTAFFGVCTKAANLTLALLGFRSREEMERFTSEALDAKATGLSSSKVAFALWDKVKEEWMHAYTDCGDVKASGNWRLWQVAGRASHAQEALSASI